ncbi:MAG: hypothetical protein SFV51_12940 [Bryobacteraceae bacterium]|nr:hypothetical protein [Bryobacteraceae bacterium]
MIGIAHLLMSAAMAQVSSVPLDLPNTPGPARGQIRPGGRVAWMSGVLPLGDTARHNDFPSAAAAANGDVWAVWVSYSGLREEIHARRFANGHWYATFPLPGVQGDVWMPQVAIDAAGNPWFVWAQQTGYPGDPERPNWDLYTTRWDGANWDPPTRLTDHPLPDINHQFLSDAKGTLWLVWQGFRDGQSDIFLRRCQDGRWSDPQQVSSHRGNDWSPVVAVNSVGHASVVWDSYRNGNYDVYMRTLRNGQWTAEEALASTPNGEANATAVYDKDGRLWIAWEELGVNWSKDFGGRSLGVKQTGTAIGQTRRVGMKVWQGGVWMQPAKHPSTSMLASEDQWMQTPRLFTDPGGRVWLMFRHRVTRYATWTWAVDSEETPNATNVRGFMNTYVTHYTGEGWLTASELPRSRDRMSSTMAGTGTPNGQFWTLWHTDTRDDSAVYVPQQNQIWSCVLTPMSDPKPYKLVPAQAATVQSALDPGLEAEAVRALRAQRITRNGSEFRIFKGDLHRHTELSTDSGGRMDGSILDFFRYMIDAAEMDYGAITDHSAGGDSEYWWWLIQKVTEMYHVPGRYVSLFGYERTPHWPKGHKNIIHAMRNVPIVKLFTRPDMPEHWSTYAIIAGDLAQNDTKLLFRNVSETGGIAIPHTLATSQGNDWTDTDEKVQPVAEIYQGARDSYEHEGAPAAHKQGPAGTGFGNNFNPGGFIWKAWEKGVRIGVIASSDHVSTHLSFAMVYSSDPTRKGVIEAIRSRRTYGATDNIVLEYWMGDHFMGEEFTAARVPELRVKVRGAGPISRLSIIRNGKYISQQAPNTQDVSFSFRDASPEPGSSYYYIRVEQADGNLAWSSPIWVNVR